MHDFRPVRAFCASREVDVRLMPPPHPYLIYLHGELDGDGDFFSILAKEVEFLELPYSLTVGDIVLCEVSELPALMPEWSRLVGVYSYPALAFRSAGSPRWGPGCEGYVIIAGHLEWTPGRNWQEVEVLAGR